MNMKSDYYRQKLFVARVDQSDTVIGKIDRWEAHEQGILHRGFTAILMYEGQYLLQHRKHPAFDACWDFTFSSHQLYKNGQLQADVDAIYQALTREWNITKNDLVDAPAKLGKVYYKAKDPNSIYTENEFDYIYAAQLKKLPEPAGDFSYGYKLVSSIQEITSLSSSYVLTPWVHEILHTIRFPASLQQ